MNAGIRWNWGNFRRFSFAMSVARPFALQEFFGRGFLGVRVAYLQVYSRTRVRPSSNWIACAFHLGVWSNQSGSGLDGIRERLNQSRAGATFTSVRWHAD